MSHKGRINQYTCATCGKSIVTIDRDEGTTPMLLNCRATPGCWGVSVSQMYHSGLQSLTPVYEWYKPGEPPRLTAIRNHVRRGGLLIRRIGAPR